MVDINKDEVGPPPLDGGRVSRLSDIVRKVTAAGCTLDEVVVLASGERGEVVWLELDWAKDWADHFDPPAAPEPVADAAGVAGAEDPTAGW